MPLPITPTSELEAINFLLQSIGEHSVSSVPDSGVSEAYIARTILHGVSREVQLKSLACNTDYDYPLIPDGDGNIILPDNVLSVDSMYQNENLVERARKLYDQDNRTFTHTVTRKVEIVWFLPWTDLPEHVRLYILVGATQRFQGQVVGATELVSFTESDIRKIKAEFMRREMLNRDVNVLRGPACFAALNRRNY
jgi:phospholipid N-methyltransferase